MGYSYAFLEKVQGKHIEKWRMKIKKQVLPVDVPKDKLENLSYLFPSSCFLPFFLSVWPKFDSSPLISISYRCPGSSPHLSSSLSIHLSSPFVPFTPPLSFSRLSFCHFAPLSVPVPLRFSSVTSSPALPVPSVSALQQTSAMRRCSCARMAGRASRARSASVLQSLRGCCANNPAARRARTATLPLPSAPPHC